jgi:hypothetical protein
VTALCKVEGGVLYPRILFRNIENVAAARGLYRISSSMMVRLTETTLMSPFLFLNYESPLHVDMFTVVQKRFSFERATADSQSSYMMVG